MQPVAAAELDRFRAAIAARMGLQFDATRQTCLGQLLMERLAAGGESADTYLRRLEDAAPTDELAALARTLTVGETYFFRNVEQFRALAEAALPQRMRTPHGGTTLRILSAGCASGEEAYSLAIVARETLADSAWSVAIRAVDLNPAALEKAALARYPGWSLRETEAAIRQRWFHRDGRNFVLSPAIRGAVGFAAVNLAADSAELSPAAGYDVIFCRNVMMYFAPEPMQALVGRLTRALAPGGFLFLGHAETLRGLSDDFDLRHTHDTFYYQRKGGDHPFPTEARNGPRRPPAMPPAEASDAWIGRIDAATQRIAALVPAAPPPLPAGLPHDLAPAFDLLGRERFAEALSHVVTAQPPAHRDPDRLLVEAVLLTHGGRFAEADGAARRLLELDGLNAGAHYVLALCAEQAGDLGRAAEHDRVASYLDPAFAMPRLHLGLLARRAGDHGAARREVAQAQLLLWREDASRLLLFGGGFGREALVALCEQALGDRRGQP